MTVDAALLTPAQTARLQLLVEGLNIVHGIETDAGATLRISPSDILVRGKSVEKSAERLLEVTPEVLDQGYVRALHICFEQLMRSIGKKSENYGPSDHYIPPVVQHVLDHAKEFKRLIVSWGHQ